MPNSTQQRAEAIFIEALDRPAADRPRFIQSQCGEDAELLARVQDLVTADAAAGDDHFLESKFMDSAGSEPSPADAHGNDRANQVTAIDSERFEIISVHDRGGLGEVLLARDRQLGRDVAIKQILEKWRNHQEAGVRFLQEAEVTGRLEHPGVVPVYALGNWPDGRPYYAMRFIEGKTLKQVIAESSRDARSIQMRGLLNRFVDVCNTIDYAHSRGVIHRDIKPSNIMVGPYGETLLVDWGLAKMLDTDFDDSLTAQFLQQVDDDRESKGDSSRTRVGGVVGTPQYMSPEQASGKVNAIGVGTDIYLLGGTLYQILTGQPPHNDQSIAELMQRIKRGDLTPPSEVNSSVPPALEAICLKAMSQHPADRYLSARALAGDLESWLADERVSVYREPVTARVRRWTRKHPAIATSGLVATLLVTTACVAGSMLWSYQQAQKFELQLDRSAKEMQLLASQAQRLNEAKELAESAWDMSNREIQANRFESAVGLLQRSAGVLELQPELDSQRIRLQDRIDRLEKLTAFYRQAEMSEEFNVMSRDTQGIMAATAALRSLGIWDRLDWWAHLPDQDLNPQQSDQLRWDAYQQWLMLDGMLVKTIGTRLFGVMQNSGGGGRLLRALRRMQTGAGRDEAEAALVVSDRIDFFRQAETTRWYRGIARYRLRTGSRVKAEDLGTPRNAADAQKMGVLCLLSAMDPSFRVVFRDYNDQDAIVAGRDLFRRSATLRPDHYWTQLALGQMQYFLARRQIANGPTQADWKIYQPAIQTMGRCIAINPNSAFALADRSSLFRFQHDRLVENQAGQGSDPESQATANELLRWSMQDAQHAYQIGSVSQPWVGWTYGMALAASGQTKEAVDVFLKTSTQTLPLLTSSDSTLIQAEDIRGRQEAAEFVQQQLQKNSSANGRCSERFRLQACLASICLNQQKQDEAQTQIDAAMAGALDGDDAAGEDPAGAHAFAVRGMLHLNDQAFDIAATYFQRANQLDPNHLWAVYGAGVCLESQSDLQAALSSFQRAATLADHNEHRAACLLGVGRVLATMGRYDASLAAFQQAQAIDAACNLSKAAEPLILRYRKQQADAGETVASELDALKQFLKRLAALPRVTKVDIPAATSQEPMRAAVLNGDFELGSLQYWNHESGIRWLNRQGYDSTAIVTPTDRTPDGFSLRVIGDAVENDEGQKNQDAYGSTLQTFPLPSKTRCQLSVWVKTVDLTPGSAKIELLIPDRPITELWVPSGEQDWTELTTDFEVGQPSDPSMTTVPVQLQIVSKGSGEVFYDDLSVTIFPQ